MKYNIERNNKSAQEKIESITKIESSQKARDIIDSATSHNSHNKAKEHKRKKYYSLYLQEEVMEQLGLFLQEFGENKENRGDFIEKAILAMIETRKSLLLQTLQEKINKLR